MKASCKRKKIVSVNLKFRTFILFLLLFVSKVTELKQTKNKIKNKINQQKEMEIHLFVCFSFLGSYCFFKVVV